MAKINNLSQNTLTQLSKIIAEYVTGSELTRLFAEVGCHNNSTETKSLRILNVLTYIQERDNCSNNVVKFIELVADPVKYTSIPTSHLEIIEELNKIILLSGMKLNENGKIVGSSKLNTIKEVEEKASKLRRQLYNRNVHSDVLRFCKPELVQENYFHAVLEATKSVAQKIRDITDLNEDGGTLVHKAFDIKKPLIAINSLRTPSEKNEHNGLKHLLLGVFAMFRNTTAHEPKITWKINETDAIDLLTTLSFIHRNLDRAFKVTY